MESMGTRIDKHRKYQRTIAAVLSVPLIVILVAGPLMPESELGGGGRRSGVTENCNESSCIVSMKGGMFMPETLKIRPGAVVVWSNEDKMPHTVTSTSSTVETIFTFDSGILNPSSTGKQWELKFDKNGTFDYLCQLHRGMEGQIVVAGEPIEAYSRMNFMLLMAAGVFGTFGLLATIKFKTRQT